MSYRIAQDPRYVGHDYWHWSVWIEAEPDEMAAVKELVWVLHPTFPQQRVTAKDRATNFRLDSAGWGTFLLKAELNFHTGDKKILKHSLRLEYPDSSSNELLNSKALDTRVQKGIEKINPQVQKTITTPRKPAVFLSYSTQDSRSAAKVRERLKAAGVEVLDQTRLVPGEIWDEAIQRMLREADAVVGIVSDDQVSPWVATELSVATKTEKPTFALFTEACPVSDFPNSVQQMQVNSFNPEDIVELLRSKS